MTRPGNWNKHKPEVIRLIQEGLDFSAIRKEYPQIPKGTLHRWFTTYSEQSAERSETVPNPPRLRLPIDPESPLEKIRNALWDIVYNPEGKGVAVQALNALIKVEQLQWEIESKIDLDSLSPEELQKIAQG